MVTGQLHTIQLHMQTDFLIVNQTFILGSNKHIISYIGFNYLVKLY